MTKRLYKSETNKAVSGVIGGMGDYFDIDPVLLRAIWILIVVFTGVVPGIIAYVLVALIVPHHTSAKKEGKDSEKEEV